jgi:hypothetical protein
MSWSNSTFDIDDLCPDGCSEDTSQGATYSLTLDDLVQHARNNIDGTHTSGLEHSGASSQDADGPDSEDLAWEDEDEDVDLVDDPRSDSHVFMARSVGRYQSHCFD